MDLVTLLSDYRVLIADDESIQRNILSEILKTQGCRVETAGGLEEAIATFRKAVGANRPFDLVLTDLKMPGGQEGLELLETVKRECPSAAVVLMTAFSTVASAVRAMKLGALDYLPKPFDKEHLLHVVGQAAGKRALLAENNRLREVVREGQGIRRMVGQSQPMQELFRLIERAAPTSANILIRGESGTGKELVARALHFSSPRTAEPFVAINCAAIPESLIESELFGHEKGTFTGATAAKSGRFEDVGKGTLFLDELGSMKFDLQAKLLRVIQEREFSRVGSSELREFRGRVVAATAQDLEAAIVNHEFREDLYFRLNVVSVTLPPLRERRDDLPLLVDHFLSKIGDRLGVSPTRLSDEVRSRLFAYDWPGNVRELENCVERMMVLGDGEELGVDLLPSSLTGPQFSTSGHSTDPFQTSGSGRTGAVGDAAGSVSSDRGPIEGAVAAGRDANTVEPIATPDRDGHGPIALPAGGIVLEDLEAQLIRQALDRTDGRLEPAAQLLGITYKTLQYRIKKYDLKERSSGAGDPPPTG